jgi:hypothetical protein
MADEFLKGLDRVIKRIEDQKLSREDESKQRLERLEATRVLAEDFIKEHVYPVYDLALEKLTEYGISSEIIDDSSEKQPRLRFLMRVGNYAHVSEQIVLLPYIWFDLHKGELKMSTKIPSPRVNDPDLESVTVVDIKRTKRPQVEKSVQQFIEYTLNHLDKRTNPQR